MQSKVSESEIIERLKKRPELLRKLGELFEVEDDVGDRDLARIELKLLELVRAIGSDSLGQAVQSKEKAALASATQQTSGRIHSKKN